MGTPWRLVNRVIDVHTVAYRLSGGLIGARLIPGGQKMLLLDHVGAKSGRKRTNPLVYIEDGDDLVIVASKGGHPRHPAWFHNLMANPDTVVQTGFRRRRVHAREASDAEHQRLWPRVVDAYGGYAGYQRKTQRKIPLVILEPRD
jgi:deazaflavin-dependent oxidoreductase (nitroreductase family)